jgi:hypothetical protein
MATYTVDESGVVLFYRPRTAASYLQTTQQATSGTPVRCPSCNILMALRKLQNHTIVAHGYGAMPTIEPARLIQKGLTASHAGDATGKRRSPGYSLDRSNSAGADPMDGSRGMEHFAREGGRFGSIPSYDDYGEQGLA